MKSYFLFLGSLLMVPALLAAPNTVEIPQEIKPFIEANSKALDIASADLNGDDTNDYVLVVEREADGKDQEPIRTVIVLIREKSGTLKAVAKNDHAVLGKDCGGVWGDPFETVEAKRKKFTIHHFGGSREKWNCSYTFGYSSKDNAWQLIRVKDTRYLDDPKQEVFAPPRDFGKIDFSEFDSEKWRGIGPK
jgi:hypothetical protein